MSNKRGNSEGSIYQRPNGSWRAQMTVDGGRLSHTAKTKPEALAWLREMGAQADRGLTYRAAQMTFHEFLRDWLKTAKGRLTFESWRSYNQLAMDYILPALGNSKLRNLTPIQIQRLYNRLLEKGIGKRTIQKTHAVIRASLNDARKMGLLQSNPASAANPPKSKNKEMKILETRTVRLMLETAKSFDPENYALYYLAVVTGMRQGELLALHWNEVNLDKGSLLVRYSLKRVPGEGLKSKKPKTKSSVRTIMLGADSCKTLQEQYDRVCDLRKDAGDNWNDWDYVFPEMDGSPIEPAKVYRSFQEVLIKAQLPKMRFHDLRHTAASLMLNNGVDVLVASKRLGHAKPSITLDFYGHLLPDIQSNAVRVLEGIARID